MKLKELQTKRLTLKMLLPEDYTKLFSEYDSSFLMDFFGFQSEQQLNKEISKVKKGLSTYDRTFVIFIIVLNQTKKAIGMCGFVRYYPSFHRAELGYALYNKTFMNHGYTTEACKRVVEYGFTELSINRMEAFTDPINSASIKVLEKLNFNYEACLKEHHFDGENFIDSNVYSLLKKNYNKISMNKR